MSLQELLTKLVAATRAPDPARSVAEELERAARDGEAIIAELGLPLDELVAWPLYRTPKLSILVHVWPAGMHVPAHEHKMWSVVASLRGTQRQRVWKDKPVGDPTIHELRAGQVIALAPDEVHSVENPGDQPAVTIHAYGGDLASVDRLTWDPETGKGRSLELWMLQRLQEEYNRLARSESAPISPARMQSLFREMAATLEAGPPAAPRRTPLGVAFDDRGSGAALVFVHGLTFGRRTWDPIVDLLADQYRCVTLDLPGHADTRMENGNLDAAVRAIESVIDELRLTRPLLVGHSAGAVIATVYAARHEVAGILNVDQPLMVERFATLVQSMSAELRGTGFADAWERFESSFGYDALGWRERARLLHHHKVEQATVLGAWSDLLTRPPAELREGFEDMFRRFERPVLAVHGLAADPQYSAWLQQTFRGPTKVESWPGMGHFPHLAEKERFAARLRAFASEVQTV